MYSLPGTLFSKTLPFRLHRLPLYTFKVLRVSSLKELFDTVEPVRIFSFLKEIGLYNKI